jgi:hypothetical protein
MISPNPPQRILAAGSSFLQGITIPPYVFLRRDSSVSSGFRKQGVIQNLLRSGESVWLESPSNGDKVVE